MTSADNLQQDLDYIAKAVRHSERERGVPAIYYLWAAIVAVGYSLPDFAPQLAGPYWFVFGIGGGIASWWLGARAERRNGKIDPELGRRHAWHWAICGFGFMICWLPALHGVPMQVMAGNFLLVAGLGYSLAGIHLERPLLWSGLLMLIAYVVLALLAPPYMWSITGVVIALSLVWAGWTTRTHGLTAVGQ